MRPPSHTLDEFEPPGAVTQRRAEMLVFLSRALESKVPHERHAAVGALIRFGADAVEPLCRALRDDDHRVSTAAARALSQVGDARALGPLQSFIRRHWHDRAARKAAYAVLAVTATSAAAFLTWLFHGIWPVFLGQCLWCLFVMYRSAQKRGRRLAAGASALAEITARHPRPDVRELLPELALAASEGLHFSSDVRHTLEAAVHRIDRLTEHLRDVPIAAAAPDVSSTEGLPLPSTPSIPDADRAPRPAPAP